MAAFWRILGWFFSVLFGVLTASMLLQGSWIFAAILFALAALCSPPLHNALVRHFKWFMHPGSRFILIAAFLGLFVVLLLGRDAPTIYSSPAVNARLMEIYDQKMKDWPVPYEDVVVKTWYGNVHAIVSGPREAPPMLLLPASGVAAWSWKFNVGGLSRDYRTYAIDMIGDAGKSSYTNMKHVLANRFDQSRLYTEIMDTLGIGKAYLVGASEGGFVATNIALFAPERVEKIVLLGPMGYSGALLSVIRVTLTQMFPLGPLQENTFRWAFSDNAHLEEEFGEWYRLLMTGVGPVKVPPRSFTKEERQSLKVPVLFVFGERDNLIGDPLAAKDLVMDIPEVRVAIVNAGHLMGAEEPAAIDTLIREFCAVKK